MLEWNAKANVAIKLKKNKKNKRTLIYNANTVMKDISNTLHG